MNLYFNILYTIASSLVILILLLVVTRYIKEKTAGLFWGGMSFLSSFLWILSLWMYYSVTTESALLFWGRFNFGVTSLLGMSIPLFFLFFPENPQRRSLFHDLLFVAISIFVAYISFFTNAIALDEIFQDGKPITVFGSFFSLFIAHFVYSIGYTIFIYFRKLPHLSRDAKRQVNLMYLGIIVASVGGIVTNLILPFIFNIYTFQEIAPVFLIFFAIFTFYSIFRYSLFQLKVIFSQVLVFGVSVSLLLLIFTAANRIDLILKIGVFIVFVVGGILLIREVILNVKKQEELQKAQKELLQINAELEKSIELKDDFMRLASHQLRTPLTVVNGYLSMLATPEEKHYLLNERAFHDVSEAYGASKNLVKIVNDLMSVNAINAGSLVLEPSTIQLKPLIDTIIHDKSVIAEKKNISISNLVDKHTIFADESKLKECLNNIIDNAIFYGKSNVTLEASENESKSIIIVSDDGIGISEEDKKALWDKFNRGSRAKKAQPDGSGLGLYLVKRIIELHNGTVLIGSAGENQGTTVTITLPKEITG